ARKLLDHEPRTGLLADEAPGALERAVLMVGGQHLVALAERERPDRDVQRVRDVREVRDLVGVGAQVLGEGGARLGDQPRPAPSEERDRLPFDLALPRLVAFEHHLRAGAVRAMVEVDHVGVEQELVAERRRLHMCHGGASYPFWAYHAIADHLPPSRGVKRGRTSTMPSPTAFRRRRPLGGVPAALGTTDHFETAVDPPRKEPPRCAPPSCTKPERLCRSRTSHSTGRTTTRCSSASTRPAPATPTTT